MNPSTKKLELVADGYLLHNITGVRTHIVSRLDGKGYDITKRMFVPIVKFQGPLAHIYNPVGPHAVRTGQTVFIDDPNLVLVPMDDKDPAKRPDKAFPRYPDVQLRFYIDVLDPMFAQIGAIKSPYDALITAYTSSFGADLTATSPLSTQLIRFGHRQGVRIVLDTTNHNGCAPYGRTLDDDAVLVLRGGCTFLEKLTRAKSAGASGVVVISDEELAINPSTDAEEIAAAGDLSDVALVVIKRSAGELVMSMLNSVGDQGMGQLILIVDPEGQSVATEGRPGSEGTAKQSREHSDPSRVLYINGHALLNTRLLV